MGGMQKGRQGGAEDLGSASFQQRSGHRWGQQVKHALAPPGVLAAVASEKVRRQLRDGPQLWRVGMGRAGSSGRLRAVPRLASVSSRSKLCSPLQPGADRRVLQGAALQLPRQLAKLKGQCPFKQPARTSQTAGASSRAPEDGAGEGKGEGEDAGEGLGLYGVLQGVGREGSGSCQGARLTACTCMPASPRVGELTRCTRRRRQPHTTHYLPAHGNGKGNTQGSIGGGAVGQQAG